MCPHVHKDVGLVGLANVMRIVGRLEDALKAGQAALDINFDEVSVLSGCTYVRVCIREYVCSYVKLYLYCTVLCEGGSQCMSDMY